MVKYEFNEWQFAEFNRKKGHIIVDLSIFTNDVTFSVNDFIFDTGAYITVLSRPTARRMKLPLGTGKPVKLQGFAEEHDPIPGELIGVPKVMIGKHYVYDVKVIVPLDDVTVAEVLGENILEYLNYVIDHDKDVIYFKKNSNPKPYINEEKGIDLSCGKVLLANDV